LAAKAIIIEISESAKKNCSSVCWCSGRSIINNFKQQLKKQFHVIPMNGLMQS
jgi:hypothetical protein